MVSPPSSAPPRTKPADVRREELMDAALALFVAKSVAATSVDEIVTAAGVSKGGFYHHFASKDALLTALQDRFVGEFLDSIVAADARPAPDDWIGRLDARLETAVAGFFANVEVHDVVFHEFKPVERREMNDNVFVDEMTAFLAAGHAAGAWRTEHPRLTTVMLFHAMHGACDEAVLKPEELDRAVVLEALRRLFHSTVQPAT